MTKKRPAASKKDGPEPKWPKKSQQKSSNINYLDVSIESGRHVFKKFAKAVTVGAAIVTPAIDKEGFVLGEVVLKVLDIAEHQSGLYVQAEVAAWSNSASKKEMKVLHGKDCLAHLCKSTGSCKSSIDDKKVFTSESGKWLRRHPWMKSTLPLTSVGC